MRVLALIVKYIITPCIILGILGFMSNPKRYRYLIPEKFVGTVYVYYQVKGADPLKTEDGFQLVVVPENGVVKTSSEPRGGKFYDEFWLYSGNKRFLLPPNRIGGGGTIKRKNASGQKEVIFKFNVLK